MIDFKQMTDNSQTGGNGGATGGELEG